MRIVVASVRTPFVFGGAELHARSLISALQSAGHDAELFEVPLQCHPAERIPELMLACRLMDVTLHADLLIGLKFPAYYIRHPNKVLWILHQHRQAYDLWDHPLAGDLIRSQDGLGIRSAVTEADRSLIPEARHVYANSKNVASRLKHYCGLDSIPLYHPPPGAELFHSAAFDDYLFFPSRLTAIKRQELVLHALAKTRHRVRVVFAGAPDVPSYDQQLGHLTTQLRLDDRVQWLGRISEERKRDLYANALGVVYPPLDEDYGYVTLEAMLSGKPVITCVDSGEPVEFVTDGETGLVVPADPGALAAALDTLWDDRAAAMRMGAAACDRYKSLEISWESVVRMLAS
ncbi:MAG TPA: glycosyltransferase family 4 protein [Bryobacteraceae bacterium]|nr:glycosyltransferase family 4 protein [Bryobacteraceae bacterium]